MSSILFRDLQRALMRAGGEPALAVPEGVSGRIDQPRHNPARLIESPFRVIDPGPAQRRESEVAFLDGIQQTRLIGHVGLMPAVGARIVAG
ncbi:MAG TPA: hypothetical protein PLL69_08455, partial [Gemmatimonadales bacterium]|nr:hypothetical protein [Gemmatimonadales bacterium]